MSSAVIKTVLCTPRLHGNEIEERERERERMGRSVEGQMREQGGEEWRRVETHL